MYTSDEKYRWASQAVDQAAAAAATGVAAGGGEGVARVRTILPSLSRRLTVGPCEGSGFGRVAMLEAPPLEDESVSGGVARPCAGGSCDPRREESIELARFESERSESDDALPPKRPRMRLSSVDAKDALGSGAFASRAAFALSSSSRSVATRAMSAV